MQHTLKTELALYIRRYIAKFSTYHTFVLNFTTNHSENSKFKNQLIVVSLQAKHCEINTTIHCYSVCLLYTCPVFGIPDHPLFISGCGFFFSFFSTLSQVGNWFLFPSEFVPGFHFSSPSYFLLDNNYY